MEHVINVNGMACMGCVQSVTKALEKVAGVESVNVSLEDKKAVVQAADSVTVCPVFYFFDFFLVIFLQLEIISLLFALRFPVAFSESNFMRSASSFATSVSIFPQENATSAMSISLNSTSP